MSRQHVGSQLSFDQRFLQIGLGLLALSLTILLSGMSGYLLVLVIPIFAFGLLYSLDPSNLRVPFQPLPLYLLFSTVFYIHRDLFGWGPASVTRYDEQVPVQIQLAKDVIWVVFLLLLGFLFRTQWANVRAHFNRNAGFFCVVAAYVAWLLITGALRTGTLPTTQMTLLYLRNPSEYLPMLLLMPWFVRSSKDITGLGKTIFTLQVIVIGFLGFQVLTGSQLGTDWGGIYRRFGSIFGSPNDMGVFCAWNLTGLIALWGSIRTSLTSRFGILIGLSWALFMSVSASAVICAITGITIVLGLGRFRHSVLAVLLLCLAGGIGVYAFRDSPLIEYAQLRFIDPFTKGSLDNSQRQHLSEFSFIENEIRDWTPSEFILGSNNMRHVVGYNPDNRAAVEDYYLSLVLRSGVPALLLFLSIIAMTIRRAFRLRRVYPEWGTAGIATITSGAVAFIFIPYPDVFPTNLFFWVIAGLIWVIPITKTDSQPVYVSRSA